MITDQQIIEWMKANIAYLEIKNARDMDEGGWWPVLEDDESEHDPMEENLDLIEWVEYQIKKTG